MPERQPVILARFSNVAEQRPLAVRAECKKPPISARLTTSFIATHRPGNALKSSNPSVLARIAVSPHRISPPQVV